MDGGEDEDGSGCFPCGFYKDEPVVRAFEDTLQEMFEASDEMVEATRKGRYDSSAPLHLVILTTQAMQLLASVRHAIDAGFLFSAGVLMRPIFERLGLIAFLYCNPTRIDDWDDGWPNRTEPSFHDLMKSLQECDSISIGTPRYRVLHSLIHGNPDAAIFGANRVNDNLMSFAPNAMKDRPDLANLLAMDGASCVIRLLDLELTCFGPVIESTGVRARLLRCWNMIDPLIDTYGT